MANVTKKRTSKTISSRTSFSRRQLVIFASLFGLVGGFFLIRSFAATTVPLIYTAYPYTSTGSVANSINQINANATGSLSLYNSTTSSGTYIEPARYSPDHTTAAWTVETNGSPTGALYLEKLGTKLTTTFPMPTRESLPSHGAGLAWYPDSKHLVVQTGNPSTNMSSFWRVDPITGAFSLLFKSASYNTYVDSFSLAVLGNNQNIVFLNASGVELYTPGVATPKLIHAVSYCSKVRARPKTLTEFVYVCTTSTGVPTLWDQTTSGTPILIGSINSIKSSTGVVTQRQLSDFVLSPDSTKIGLLVTSLQAGANCQFTSSSKIGKTSYAKQTSGIVVSYIAQAAAPVTLQGCKGGQSQFEANQINWSPDGLYIAYINTLTGGQLSSTSGPLYSVPSSATLSTAPSLIKQLATNAEDTSW